MDTDLISSDEQEFEDDAKSDSDIDDASHIKLLDAISSLDNLKKKPIKQRTEAAGKVGEFSLNEAEDSKVSLGDLVGSLRKTGKHVKLKKQIRAASKQKVLPTPLPKPQAEQVGRAITYKKVSTDVDKWNNIVQKNRLAEQIIYPLKRSDLRIQPLEAVVQRYQSNKTPMEQEISELLNESNNVAAADKELTPAEEEALNAMSLEEALERRNELRKMRALQTYQEAKARRQNKIKSKKYHRLLKKDRLKKQMKDFEALQKLNPELALQKLEEMDKSRVGERMSLKHRNTGKWAKHHMIRAKYNNESRAALREQIEINKKMTEKKKAESESEEEVEEELVIDMERKQINNESSDEEGNFSKEISSSEKRWQHNGNAVLQEHVSNQTEEEEESLIHETLERKKTLQDFEFSQSKPGSEKVENTKSRKIDNSNQPSNNSAANKKVEVDPTNFISLDTKNLKSAGPDFTGIEDEVLESDGDDNDEDAGNNYMTIQEAFADDDVIAEFKADKQAIVDQETPKDIDLTLPGWGSWGGPGLKVSKRKRKRFTIKAKPAAPRKDRNLGNVIINENSERSVAAHQVSELPHQFKSVAQFQSSIKTPIGKTWNPETAVKLLTKPKVVTKLGAIIQPMDAEELANSIVAGKKPPKKRKRNKNKS